MQTIETDIFKSLAQQYGAQIDISRSHSVVRLTADFPTCYDLFKLIHFALDNIHQDELTLTKSKLGSAANVDARRILDDKSVLQHLEKLTSTLITPIRNQNVPTKVRETILQTRSAIAKHSSVTNTLSGTREHRFRGCSETCLTGSKAKHFQGDAGSLRPSETFTCPSTYSSRIEFAVGGEGKFLDAMEKKRNMEISVK